MYYINRVLNERYELINTEISEVNLCDENELKGYLDQGLSINGVAKVGDKFSVMPVGNMVNLTKCDMTRNKLLYGTCTGIVGFDIEFRGNDIIALPLSPEFFDYVLSVKKNSIYIIQIPEIVTKISDDFMTYLDSKVSFRDNLILCLELSSAITDLSYESVISGSTNIIRIHHSQTLDRIYHKTSTFRSSLPISYFLDKDEFTLRVRKFSSRVLDLMNRNLLYLPNTEVLGTDCFTRGFYTGVVEFYLGKSISHIGDFHINIPENYDLDAGTYTLNVDKLMSLANIVYLPDGCNLGKLDFSDGMVSGYYSSYIFVLSRAEYRRLSGIFLDADLHYGIALGVLCYDNEDELNFIRSNIKLLCKNPSKYFLNFLRKSSLGCVVDLELWDITL